MCQSMPCRVVETKADGTAVVSDRGRLRQVSLLAADDLVARGDWVLVLSGLVISRLTEDEAALTNATWAAVGAETGAES